MHCPICEKQEHLFLYHLKARDFYQCQHCRLIWVPEQFHLSEKQEKARYDLHTNNPADTGYRKFLEKLTIPLIDQIKLNSKGLDYGCGPGPTLSVILEEQGYTVSLYDYYYYPHHAVLEAQYDFITMTEVIEHLFYPKQTLEDIISMLNPEGVLGIMTQLYDNIPHFEKWWYKDDLTHVNFFHSETFRYISEKYNLDLTIKGNDVILLKK